MLHHNKPYSTNNVTINYANIVKTKLIATLTQQFKIIIQMKIRIQNSPFALLHDPKVIACACPSPSVYLQH